MRLAICDSSGVRRALNSVLDGRPELFEEIESVDAELRRYIAAEKEGLPADGNFVEAVPGQLPGDAASHARLPQPGRLRIPPAPGMLVRFPGWRAHFVLEPPSGAEVQ